MPTNDIEAAVAALEAGQLVAMPTETVYGLAADASNGAAIAAVFATKARPRFNPLICHVASLSDAARLATFNQPAKRLAETFWPGALTLVLPRRSDAKVSDLVTAGLETIAVRIPMHPVAQALLQGFGKPLAAPSANRSGRVSPTTAEHVQSEFGNEVAVILDGGPAKVGIESTVLDVTGKHAKLLRPGGIPRETIDSALDQPLVIANSSPTQVQSPGQLQSHYAPTAKLRLDVKDVSPGEALLAFGPEVPKHTGPIINLSESGNVDEAAQKLFSALRALDATNPSAIAVMPIPERSLGEAINDRLRRAAAPRS